MEKMEKMSDDKLAQQSKLCYLLGHNYGLWTCHDPDYYSFITPKIIIDKIIELADEHFNGLRDKVVLDMFAGIGCDGIRFAKHAGKVICTEINPDTFKDLEQNVKTMNMYNVETHNIDCCDYLDSGTSRFNIVYFDPPWGDTFRSGEPFDFRNIYVKKTDQRSLPAMSVLHLAQKVSMNHHLIIKAPISSDSFERLFGDRVSEIFTFTQQKLKFLIVKAVDYEY